MGKPTSVKVKATKLGLKISITFTQLMGLRTALNMLDMNEIKSDMVMRLVKLIEWLPCPTIPQPEWTEDQLDAWSKEWRRAYNLVVPADLVTSFEYALVHAGWLSQFGMVLGESDTYFRRINAIEKLTAVDRISMAGS